MLLAVVWAFFFWPAPCAFRRVAVYWDLLVYHVTIAAPYPGGIDPRLAVHARSWDGHHTTTRRDRLGSGVSVGCSFFVVGARCLSAGRTWDSRVDQQGFEPPPAVCQRWQDQRHTNWAIGSPGVSVGCSHHCYWRWWCVGCVGLRTSFLLAFGCVLILLVFCVGRYAFLTGGNAFLPNAGCRLLFFAAISCTVHEIFLSPFPSILFSPSGPSHWIGQSRGKKTPATSNEGGARTVHRPKRVTRASPRLPHKVKIHVAKCHACQTKWQVTKRHACHVKRSLMSPSAHAGHVKRRRGQNRPLRPKRVTGASLMPYFCFRWWNSPAQNP